MTIVKKTAVAIHIRSRPLANDASNAGPIEARVQLRPRRALHTMDGPQNLGQASQIDDVANFSPCMVGGKAAMVSGMPVLRGHHQVEVTLEVVKDAYDFMPSRDSQHSARTEVVLNVHD
jgi:hypothetical protein